jgi:hypothetical protein
MVAKHRRIVRFHVLALLVAAFAALPASEIALARARPTTARVVIVIQGAKASASQNTVPAGAVVFAVVNNGPGARILRVAGKSSGSIRPGKHGQLTVVLGAPGSVRFVVVGRGSTISGMLRVRPASTSSGSTPSSTAPSSSSAAKLPPPATCAQPATTTVAVTMNDNRFTFSPSPIPCGTVTFAMTNVGTTMHQLYLDTPDGSGPGLAPGQSAQMTLVNLGPGTVTWHCAAPEHEELFPNEHGVITIA